MLVSDDDALKRINSPMNLINKIKSNNNVRGKAMSIFTNNKTLEKSEIKNEIKNEEIKVNDDKVIPFNPFPKVELLVRQPSAVTPQINSSNQVPSSESLIENADSQIKLGLAHDSAIEVMKLALDKMKTEIDNIKPEKLPSVLSAAAKTVEGIRRERNEVNKNSKGKEVHYHFYTPERKTVADYEVIEVEPAVISS